jgi:hypothetical protein
VLSDPDVCHLEQSEIRLEAAESGWHRILGMLAIASVGTILSVLSQQLV